MSCYKIPQRFAETFENWEALWYHILTGSTNRSETALWIMNHLFYTYKGAGWSTEIVPVKIQSDEMSQFSERSANVSVTTFLSGLQKSGGEGNSTLIRRVCATGVVNLSPCSGVGKPKKDTLLWSYRSFLKSIVLHCIVLYCNVLYCIVMYCIVL